MALKAECFHSKFSKLNIENERAIYHNTALYRPQKLLAPLLFFRQSLMPHHEHMSHKMFAWASEHSFGTGHQ